MNQVWQIMLGVLDEAGNLGYMFTNSTITGTASDAVSAIQALSAANNGASYQAQTQDPSGGWTVVSV